ncbi:MAG: hypothetical protein H6739_24530 [Alphaproteobacteria bacterium]|nr:hypothetical protein [Alphaproteobacteria bacterium]
MDDRDEKGPVGLDDILDVQAGKGRYEGPEVVEDPAEVAKRMRRRSNMNGLSQGSDEPRKRLKQRKSGLDDIFGN